MYRPLAAIALLLVAAGCAISPNRDAASFAARTQHNSFEVLNRQVKPEALVLPVTQDRQTEGPACGAHALASIVNYWRGGAVVDGLALFRRAPPGEPDGYSMAELLALARTYGLAASAVRLSTDNIVAELEKGRPVLAPVRLPSIYVQQRVLPGGDTPFFGLVRNTLISRSARFSELSHFALVNHYLVLAGYEGDTFVTVEPVMGFRTISRARLERYRRAFDDAAIVFSAAGPPPKTGS